MGSTLSVSRRSSATQRSGVEVSSTTKYLLVPRIKKRYSAPKVLTHFDDIRVFTRPSCMNLVEGVWYVHGARW